jgi:hypothetical protein
MANLALQYVKGSIDEHGQKVRATKREQKHQRFANSREFRSHGTFTLGELMGKQLTDQLRGFSYPSKHEDLAAKNGSGKVDLNGLEEKLFLGK